MNKYLNAAQVFDQYGIPRTALLALVEEGRIHPHQITTASGYIRLYLAAEIEALITETDEPNNDTY